MTLIDKYLEANPNAAEARTHLEAFLKWVESLPKAPKSSRPGEGTLTGKVWTLADSLTTADHIATRKEVMDAGKKVDLNEATIATQYQRWLANLKKTHPERFVAPAPAEASAKAE